MSLSPLQPEFERNLGFMSEEEQLRLNTSAVGIAGAGGDGGMLALQLARLGVGELRLADPDPFELENTNRQACCTRDTVGVNKARAVGEYITKINPDITVITYEEGVTQDNVGSFATGLDLVIDETEFTLPTVGVMLARAARHEGIPNLMAMNIGFGATVTSFAADGMTFEKMLGLTESDSLDEVAVANVGLSRWLPYIPPYVDLDAFKSVAAGEKSAPSIAPGVALAAGMAATQALLHLVEEDNQRPKPVTAPAVLVMDAMTGQSKEVRLTRRNHYASLAKMYVRHSLGFSPKTSY